MYLIQPLHGAYELNPVALAAQGSVLIPDGLDLDAWIVPPPKEPAPELDAEAKARKVKKGKGKEVNGTKAKTGKKKHKDEINEGNGVVLTPPEDDMETPEQALERAQVCTHPKNDGPALTYYNSGKPSGESDCVKIHITLLTTDLQPRCGSTKTLIRYRWYDSKECLHSPQVRDLWFYPNSYH